MLKFYFFLDIGVIFVKLKVCLLRVEYIKVIKTWYVFCRVCRQFLLYFATTTQALSGFALVSEIK